MIVETPDHQIVIGNKLPFRGQHWVGFFFWQLIGNIEMIEERRFVSDDEIVARGSGSLKHIECGHHGHGNPCHWRVGIAGLEGVHGIALPRNSHLLLNTRNHFTRCEVRTLGLRASDQKSADDRSCKLRLDDLRFQTVYSHWLESTLTTV